MTLSPFAAPYLAETRKLVSTIDRKRFAPFWTQPPKTGEWHGLSSMLQSFLFIYALLYRHEERPQDLKRAREFLDLYLATDADGAEHFAALFTGKAYELLAPALTADERERFANHWVDNARPTLDKFVGTDLAAIDKLPTVGNHPLCAAVYADYARHLFPERCATLGMEKTTDRVWQRLNQLGEFHEQASNYEGFAEVFLCQWVELRSAQESFCALPTVQNLFARHRRIVSPAGIVVAYADSGHYEHAAAWMALFEKLATLTGDPEWHAVAVDVFAGLRRAGIGRMAPVLGRLMDDNLYAGRGAFNLWVRVICYVGLAGLWRDETGRAVAPTCRAGAGDEGGSRGQVQPSPCATDTPGSPDGAGDLLAPRRDPAGVVLRLPAGTALEPADRTSFPTAKAIPAQVALTGGSADPAKRTYLLLSVGPKFPHDHADAGAILLLSRGPSCLIATNGYLERELLYHNTFFVQRADVQPFPDDTPGRAFLGDPACAGELLELHTEEHTGRCRVRFARYHGYPVDLEREVVVDAAGNVTLLDRVTAHEAGLCGGLLFHAERIRRLTATRFRLRLEKLLSMNGHEWRNGPGQVEVEFCTPAAPVVQRRLKEPAIYHHPAYNAFPTKHYREIWRRSYTARQCLAIRLDLPKGEPVLFLTRLMPV